MDLSHERRFFSSRYSQFPLCGKLSERGKKKERKGNKEGHFHPLLSTFFYFDPSVFYFFAPAIPFFSFLLVSAFIQPRRPRVKKSWPAWLAIRGKRRAGKIPTGCKNLFHVCFLHFEATGLKSKVFERINFISTV